MQWSENKTPNISALGQLKVETDKSSLLSASSHIDVGAFSTKITRSFTQSSNYQKNRTKPIIKSAMEAWKQT